MVNGAEVREFYDDFLKSRMLSYRLYGNERLEKAAARVLPEIRRNHRVLDVGCGIGIVTERMADKAMEGYVWGLDISEKNIWYAKQTISRNNLSFMTADVSQDLIAVARQLQQRVDIVTLLDVIEHIPAPARPDLFVKLREISTEEAILILTYPSPQYQRYLQKHNPEELQIIDNIIEIDDLMGEAKRAGYFLRHYSLETVWQKNQYVHCIFQTNETLEPPEEVRRNVFERALARLKHELDSRLLVNMRKRKYVDRIFGTSTKL